MHSVAVINKGIPGSNSRDGLNALDENVLALKPQHAILYFGMNDAMNSRNPLPLPVYEDTMRTMARRFTGASLKTVALVTLNPVIVEYVQERHPNHPQKDSMQEHLAKYDRTIRTIAAENKFPLIDLRKIVEDNGGARISEDCLVRCEKNGGGKDGVHLTAAAYNLFGKQAFDVLKDRVRKGDTVVCFGDSLTYGAHVKGAGTTTGETYPAVLQAALDAYGAE
jgi:lysophospholipase L1-like esterase